MNLKKSLNIKKSVKKLSKIPAFLKRRQAKDNQATIKAAVDAYYNIKNPVMAKIYIEHARIARNENVNDAIKKGLKNNPSAFNERKNAPKKTQAYIQAFNYLNASEELSFPKVVLFAIAIMIVVTTVFN